MKTRWIIVALTACIAVSLYLRIVLPYDNVFTGQWIKFTSIDAYWQMIHVDKMAPDFSSYITKIFSVPTFQWLLSGVIWCVGLGNPTQHAVDTVAVYFPTILAALTIIPVYFIGRILFSKWAGLVSAALIAILPGEWLGRSILGFTDHHVAEVLFSTTALMFFLLALKALGERKFIYAFLAVLFLFICFYSWTSGILVAAIIAIYIVIRIALGQFRYYMKLYYISTLLVFVALAIVIIENNSGLISTMWAYLTSSATVATTLEMRPLFFPAGTFTPMAAWGNFGTFLFIAPVALVLLLKRAVKYKDSNALFLLVWSLVMLAAALCFRRFAYYFAINVALLGGFIAWYLWQRISDKTIAVAITMALLLIMLLPNFQTAFVTAKYVSFGPSNAWMKALEWTKNNSPKDSVILAWWDYGYWIARETGRTAYVNPSQDKIPVVNTAKMFLSPSDNNTVDADYIIIDYDTVMGKFWSMATWAGDNPMKFSGVYYIVEDGNYRRVHLFYPEYYQSLAVRLYNFNGKAVAPTQSTVIGINPDGQVLHTVDVFSTYEEAVANCSAGEKLIGTSPFISPVPVGKVDGYSLVYESDEKIEGVSEVKIFRKEVK